MFQAQSVVVPGKGIIPAFSDMRENGRGRFNRGEFFPIIGAFPWEDRFIAVHTGMTEP